MEFLISNLHHTLESLLIKNNTKLTSMGSTQYVPKGRWDILCYAHTGQIWLVLFIFDQLCPQKNEKNRFWVTN